MPLDASVKGRMKAEASVCMSVCACARPFVCLTTCIVSAGAHAFGCLYSCERLCAYSLHSCPPRVGLCASVRTRLQIACIRAQTHLEYARRPFNAAAVLDSNYCNRTL
eukprot:6204197-Pleurochrysis_carterae.AAC.3